MSKIFYTKMAGCCVLFVVLSFLDRAGAQVNSWTNPASAPWETMYWSLGVLPDNTQSIMITNAGYKAVGISASTRDNFPNSLTMSNLTVFAPTNAFSTLLLNYLGTNVPLEVLNVCTIGTNGLIENLYSAFEIQSRLTIDGGQYIQQGGVTIATNGGFSTGVYVGAGSLNLTNAIFQGSIGVVGTVTQVEGQTSGRRITVYGGSYNLLSGTVTGGVSSTMDFFRSSTNLGGQMWEIL